MRQTISLTNPIGSGPPAEMPVQGNVLILRTPHFGTAVERAQWDVAMKIAPLVTGGLRDASGPVMASSPQAAGQTTVDNIGNSFARLTLSEARSQQVWRRSNTRNAGWNHALNFPLIHASIPPSSSIVPENLDRYSQGRFMTTSRVDTQMYTQNPGHRVNECQMYTATVSLKQTIPNEAEALIGNASEASQAEPTFFEVLLDTGSNMSWLLGAEYEIVDTRNNPEVSRDTAGKARILSPVDHGVVWSHPFDVQQLPGQTREPSWPPEMFNTATVRYLSSAVAEVTIPTNHGAIPPATLHGLYHWAGKRWERPLTVPYRFGIAYRVTDNLRVAYYDGIWGLGTSLLQDGIGFTDSTAKSFLDVLRPHLRRSRSTSNHPGLVLYWGLRLPSSKIHSSNTADNEISLSWLAFNTWPCPNEAKLRWVDIPLSPVARYHKTWTIRLTSMEFFDTSTGALVSIGVVPFPGGYLDIVLDTGSSASWFPRSVTSALRKTIFASPENAKLEEEKGDATFGISGSKPSFVVPSAFRRRLVNFSVRYYFDKSQTKQSHFRGPFCPFMCTASVPDRASRPDEDLAGLIFELPETVTRAHPHFAILGVNFFQSMFVAMHYQPDRAYGAPFVQVAPQWRSERPNFTLPSPV